MICRKSLQKLSFQFTKCAIIIMLWASTVFVFSFLSNQLLTVRYGKLNDNTGSEILPVEGETREHISNINRDNVDYRKPIENINKLIQNSENKDVNIDSESIKNSFNNPIKQHGRDFEEKTDKLFEMNTDLSKAQRKLANNLEPSTVDSESVLDKRYNVTPNAFWLKEFYKINPNGKRKTLFDFPFMIDARDICAKSHNPFLVIMVLSVHTHIDTREAIRNTWGRAANPGVWPKVGILQNNVKLIFLFGKGNTALKNAIVKDESNRHKDVVQADFEDTYFNLSYKVITGIRWVAEFCPGAKYILKADEDVFVHVHNLVRVLTKVKGTERAMFFGHTNENSKVLRTGRWEVTAKAFPFPVYPTYTCGNTYVIPGSRAKEIYKTAGYLDYMNIEDVFVTGILRTIIGAGIKDVVGFTHWYEKKPRPCEFKNSIRISATRVTDSLQYDLWEGMKTNITDCYKVVKKKPNIERPEYIVKYRPVIRDDHIYYNKTSKQFYSVG